MDVLIIDVYSSAMFILAAGTYHAVTGKGIPAKMFVFVFALMLARGIATGINLQLGPMAEKYAGDFAMFWFLGVVRHTSVPADAASFAVLGLLASPGFMIFGVVKAVVLAVNNAALALAPYLFFVSAREAVPKRAAKLGAILLALYPAANYFGFFGLRDPVIYLGVTLIVLGLLRITARVGKGLESSVFLGAGGVVSLWSRPELATIVVPAGFLVYFDLIRRYRSPHRRVQHARVLLGMAGLPVLMAGLFMAFRVATRDIGLSEATINGVVSEYGRIRYERQFEDRDASGDQSPIIPRERYGGMPPWQRVAIQSAGMIVLPFPTQIRGASHLLAFGDSLLLVWVMLLTVRYGRPRPKGPFFWSTLVAVVVMGTVVNNFGNAFRMRLVLVPLVVGALVDAVRRASAEEVREA